MKFAVMGSGGVGGYFGGRLAQAGHDVTFVARGAHLAAIRERGLRVFSTEGDFEVQGASATDDPASIGPVEIVLLAVKTWQVAEAAAHLSPLLGPGSAVLTLQNGVEAPDEVARICGRERVLAGVCRLMSYVSEPGVIRHAGVTPRVEFGEWAGGTSARAEALRKALAECQGLAAAISTDVALALWEKFLFIAPFSAVGAATRKPAGQWRHIKETRALLTAAMHEVVDLAQARGVRVPRDAVDRTLAFTDRLQDDATASMQRDLLEGRPSELEAQTGAIVRLAREAGIETPANDFLYAVLLPAERQARGVSFRSPDQQP
jgi:2-dehydropantoate 2-reductase